MRSAGIPIEQTAVRMFNSAFNSAGSTMRQLSTGYRITRAADDPAGLIGSEFLRSSLMALEAETRSLDRADAVASTADGALGEISGLLGEAEELAVAAANTGATTPEERDAMQLELDSIMQSVDRLSASAFNGRPLFNGGMSLSVGQDSITFAEVSSSALGISGVSVSSGHPEAAAEAIRAAREQVSTARAQIGSFQKDAIAPRLRSIDVAAANTASAVSFIRDTDYASAASDLARQRVLLGAAGRIVRLSSLQNQATLDLLNSPARF